MVTGGTFDKDYNERTGELFFRETHVREMLAMGRCRLPVRVRVAMMKDSLDMTDDDRRRLLAACRACPERRIVVTHGTDTLEDTARFLGPRVTEKTVVITGAMVPYRLQSSDGLFNLGSALAFAQVLGPGVYAAMNGRLFPWDRVRKNRRLGIFVRGAPAGAPAARRPRTATRRSGGPG